jgi:hypothetical protein
MHTMLLSLISMPNFALVDRPVDASQPILRVGKVPRTSPSSRGRHLETLHLALYKTGPFIFLTFLVFQATFASPAEQVYI